MKIAIFGNDFSDSYTKYIKHLINKLENEDIEVIIHHQFYDFLQNTIELSDKISTFERITKVDNFNYLFSIGGDGTLLRARVEIELLQVMKLDMRNMVML